MKFENTAAKVIQWHSTKPGEIQSAVFKLDSINFNEDGLSIQFYESLDESNDKERINTVIYIPLTPEQFIDLITNAEIPLPAPETLFEDARKFIMPKCDLCDDMAIALVRYPNGCACFKNIYQRRCKQHLIKASGYEVVEDYLLKKE